MKGQSSDRLIVNFQKLQVILKDFIQHRLYMMYLRNAYVILNYYLDSLRSWYVPHSDGAVVRCRDDRVLSVRVVNHARHLLGVTFQDCNNLPKQMEISSTLAFQRR